MKYGMTLVDKHQSCQEKIPNSGTQIAKHFITVCILLMKVKVTNMMISGFF